MDSIIYMEDLLVVLSVRINGDHVQRGPGVTASFKPTQRRSTPVTCVSSHFKREGAVMPASHLHLRYFMQHPAAVSLETPEKQTTVEPELRRILQLPGIFLT